MTTAMTPEREATLRRYFGDSRPIAELWALIDLRTAERDRARGVLHNIQIATDWDQVASLVSKGLRDGPAPEAERAWRDIATAPKDGTHVLGWTRAWGGNVHAVYYLTGLGRWQTTMQPTHWMPMPLPPSPPQEPI